MAEHKRGEDGSTRSPLRLLGERILFTAAVTVLAGCSTPEAPVVYVNLDEALAARAVRPEIAEKMLDAVRVPIQQIEAPETTYTLEALTTSEGFKEQLEERRRRALEATRRLRLEMEHELRDAAIRRVAKDVQRKRTELSREAEQKKEEAYESLRPQLERIAETYGQLKARLLVRIAVLSAEGAAPVVEKQREELTALRAELARLDEEQRLEAERLERDLEYKVEFESEKVQVLLEEFAQNRIRDELAAIERILESETFELRMMLPERPETPELSTVREVLFFPSITSVKESHHTERNSGAAWFSEERAILARQVRLWAAAKGYRLVTKPTHGARDVTSEFLAEFAR